MLTRVLCGGGGGENSRGRLSSRYSVGKMFAPSALCILYFATLVLPTICTAVENNLPTPAKNELLPTKIELFDGVYAEIPAKNNTDKLISIEVNTNRDISEGRGKSKKKSKLLAKILPLFIMPFVLQSAIIPLFLGALKFMLFKALMVGKLALALIVLNAFKNHNSFKGRDAEVANVHYGYHGNGMEEYGAYIN